MQWQYRTLLIEFQKDGLLGDKYIDDEAVENLLNKQGASGWELVNVAMIQEGLLAFCKRPALSEKRRRPVAVNSEPVPARRELPIQESEPSEPVSAALLQQEERELIQQLEMKRRKTMSALESDAIGGIKIS